MLIVVIVILVIAAVFGMIRGMVNSLSGIIALILSVILVTLLMPVVTSLIGIFGVAAALNGFLFRPIPWPLRIVIATAGLLMMDPNVITDIIGIVLFALVFSYQYLAGRTRGKAA